MVGFTVYIYIYISSRNRYISPHVILSEWTFKPELYNKLAYLSQFYLSEQWTQVLNCLDCFVYDVKINKCYVDQTDFKSITTNIALPCLVFKYHKRQKCISYCSVLSYPSILCSRVDISCIYFASS